MCRVTNFMFVLIFFTLSNRIFGAFAQCNSLVCTRQIPIYPCYRSVYFPSSSELVLFEIWVLGCADRGRLCQNETYLYRKRQITCDVRVLCIIQIDVVFIRALLSSWSHLHSPLLSFWTNGPRNARHAKRYSYYHYRILTIGKTEVSMCQLSMGAIENKYLCNR